MRKGRGLLGFYFFILSLIPTVIAINVSSELIFSNVAHADSVNCTNNSFGTTCSGSNGTTYCSNNSFGTSCSGPSGSYNCTNNSFGTSCSGNGISTIPNSTPTPTVVYRYSTPTPNPVGSNSTLSDTSTNTKVCISGKDYVTQCFDYPDWTYEICSVNPSGEIQFLSAGNWLKGWLFKGVKDSSRCTSNSYPYLISIQGVSHSQSNFDARLYFYKSKAHIAFYSNFKISIQ